MTNYVRVTFYAKKCRLKIKRKGIGRDKNFLKLTLWRELLFNFKRIALFLAMDNNQVNQASQINQAPSQNRFSKILGGAGRYLFGLFLFELVRLE